MLNRFLTYVILIFSILSVSCKSTQDEDVFFELFEFLDNEQNPEFEQVVLRGIIGIELEKYDQSIEDFTKALDILSYSNLEEENVFFDSIKVLFLRAKTYSLMGDLSNAELDYKTIFEIDSMKIDLDFQMAMMYFDIGEYEIAFHKFYSVDEISNYFIISKINQAICLKKLGRFEESILKISEAIELDSNSYEELIFKGDILFTLDRIEEACECYEQALKILTSGRLPMFDNKRQYIDRVEIKSEVQNQFLEFCFHL